MMAKNRAECNNPVDVSREVEDLRVAVQRQQ